VITLWSVPVVFGLQSREEKYIIMRCVLEMQVPPLKVEQSQQTPALRIRSREHTQEEGIAFLHRENTDLIAENRELKARLAQISLRLAESDRGMEPSFGRGSLLCQNVLT
jgi:hypothetical protein